MRTQEVERLNSLYGGFWNHDVLDFCYMTNRYFPPKQFMDDLQARLPELVGSYPSTNAHLSSLLAEQLGLSQDELVVGNGASELISAVINRHVHGLAVPVPTFEEFINRAHILGRQVFPFKASRRFELDVDAFISHILVTNADSALLIRPNNPTGNYLSKGDLIYFLNRVRSLNLVLVDESFLDFVDAESDKSALDMLKDYPNMVVLKSLSKNCGIPGIRLGYAASGDAERLTELRNDLPIWSINSLAQFFLQEMGKYTDEYVDSCQQVTKATQKLVWDLSSVPFLNPYPTQGNFVLCEILYGLTGDELATKLFEDSRILVNSCGSKLGLDGDFIRVACRTDQENRSLIEALQRIAQNTEKKNSVALDAR
ncbi:MAG: histidinol-phosphate aminotransferase family protein [Chloroflexi bacterium]|nr:histidinol-phosphate aminotransferase family protein [Chloroflexota bacterium]